MRVLVMGASGMLGHKVYQTFGDSGHEVYGTVRKTARDLEEYGLDPANIIEGINARIPETVEGAFQKVRPETVINCIGVIKPLAKDPLPTVELNALFPNRLARYCDLAGARMIQVSTDCVFSGRDGYYTEESMPDPEDLYGRTKVLGEVTYAPHLTIRTSIVGRELGSRFSLIEWILSQKGDVNGFINAWFTGLTTRVLSRVLKSLSEIETAQGLLHVAGERVNKYDLLKLVDRYFGLGLTIHKYEDFYNDRSLVAKPFGELGIPVPGMEEMIAEMAAEDAQYRQALPVRSGRS